MDLWCFSLSFCFYLSIFNALSRINVHNMSKNRGKVLVTSELSLKKGLVKLQLELFIITYKT